MYQKRLLKFFGDSNELKFLKDKCLIENLDLPPEKKLYSFLFRNHVFSIPKRYLNNLKKICVPFSKTQIQMMSKTAIKRLN